MCASYGLDGGGIIPLPDDLEPLSEPGPRTLLDEWMEQRSGSAKITGKNARNLNPIIRVDEGDRQLKLGWWWLWQHGGGPVKFTAFNARDDNLLGRAWKRPFQRRAILPATWYVEKKGRFHLPDHAMFGIAAITNDVIEEETDEPLITYTMVTRQAPADSEAAEYWPRMPLVLPRDLHDEWLDPERPGDDTLVAEVRHGSEEISAAMTTA